MGYIIDCFNCDEPLDNCECEETETYTTCSDEGPSCPHCGYIQNITEYEAYNLYEDGEHKETCPDCQKKYEVSTYTSYSWTSTRIVDQSKSSGGYNE